MGQIQNANKQLCLGFLTDAQPALFINDYLINQQNEAEIPSIRLSIKILAWSTVRSANSFLKADPNMKTITSHTNLLRRMR
jgi:hypothetical protein